MAAWMLYSAGVAVLIACAASAADVFLRGIRKPVRGVWLGGMLTALLLSGVSLVRLQSAPPVAEPGGVLLPTRLELKTESAVSPAARALQFVRGVGRDVRRFGRVGVERVYSVTHIAAGGRVSSLLVGAWATASVLLVAFFSWTVMRMARSRRAWPPHRIGDIRVLVSPASGPALVGLVHPAIVVPVWLLAETADRQQLVVQHEQEHLRARDHAVIALACMIACLLPWNPAVWWMLRRTRLAVELDCDARVLRRGARAHSYGSLLLDIAGRTRARPFSAPAIADSRTHLERRIIAMTEITRTPRHGRGAAAAAAALLLGVAACTADMPTAAEIDDLDVAQAQQQAENLGFVTTSDEGATLYFVDGVLVSEADAQAVLADRIVSVEMLRRDAAKRIYGDSAASGVIRMRTLATQTVLDTAATFERVPYTAAEGADASKRKSEVRMLAMPRSETRILIEDSPLLVLDGVIAPSSFSMRSLDPASIERVEVLKGAAARALYSNPRAANGVIHITTKKGGSR